jgi:uncharacterized phage infection (PIP) family protein YhgE
MKAPVVGIALALFLIIPGYAEETYPTLKIGDETYKNVRIVKATPLELTLLYDGGGRTIKLEDLPPGLKEKYPYSEAKASEFRKKQAAEQKALAEQQQKRWSQDGASVRAELLIEEQKLRQKLEPLELEMKRLQKDIGTQTQIAKGAAKRSPSRQKLDEMRKKMMKLRDQQEALTDQIKALQKRRAKYE